MTRAESTVLAAASLVLMAGLALFAAASRSADQPAPIAHAATGIEQGTPTPAAGPRTAVPRHRIPPARPGVAQLAEHRLAGAPGFESRSREAGGRDLRGWATWYSASGNVAAAGPALRRWLGHDWRGTAVRVSADGRSVVVTLSDFCQCFRGDRRERLIDLSDDAFAQLAPLPTGVLRVTVAASRGGPAATPPATDTE